MGKIGTAREAFAQAVRYYAVAALVAAGYLGVYGGVLVLGGPYPLAIAVAQVVTIAWAFPVYRTFVFRWEGNPWAAFPRFLGVWGGGLVAGIVATPLLIELGGVDPFPAQVVTMVVISLASFVLHRVLTFRRRG